MLSPFPASAPGLNPRLPLLSLPHNWCLLDPVYRGGSQNLHTSCTFISPSRHMVEEPDENLSPCSTIGEEGDGATEQTSTDSSGNISSDERVCVFVYTVPWTLAHFQTLFEDHWCSFTEGCELSQPQGLGWGTASSYSNTPSPVNCRDAISKIKGQLIFKTDFGGFFIRYRTK